MLEREKLIDFDPERNPVEVLADEFSSRLRQGECPSVTEYVEKYPDLANEINDVFPSIALMEQLGRKEQIDRNVAKSQAAFQEIPVETLGDYRLVKEIGRGGMGVVYEAVQESLGRRVALKILNSNLVSSPKQLQRFHREAQAAARLHHNNIVPVFGVGDQDGLHYYVMQIIDGVGLDEVLGELRRSRDDVGRSSRPTDEHPSSMSAVAAAHALRSGSLAKPRQPGSSDHHWQASNSSSKVAELSASGIGHCDTEEIRGGSVDSETTADTETERPSETNVKLEKASPRLSEVYWSSAARIGVQLADALHYAHSQRVLHRDIKPSNLLLDQRGNIWITDFGLAKHAQHDDLTNTGDIVGTLKYMAPEQFDGESNTKTDIYSLGLTLYELVTLHSAVDDSDRNRLIKQVTQGEPIPPRKHNPRVPRDLETIVLKSISRESSGRYATAAQLADELQRFLEGRPIQARRITIPERLWRWSRRNPAVASLSGLAVMLLILVAVVATCGYVRTTHALERESAERQKAENTLKISLEALDEVYVRFAPDRRSTSPQYTITDENGEEIEVPVQPVLSKETAAMLEGILKVYDRFAAQDIKNTKLRFEAAKANRRIGDIHQRLGQNEQAVAAYIRAIEKFQDLNEQEKNLEATTEIARINNELGIVYRTERKYEESKKAYSRAMTLLQDQLAKMPASNEVQYQLARTYYLQGRRPTFGFGPGFGPPRDGKPPRHERQEKPRGDGNERGRFHRDSPVPRHHDSDREQHLEKAIELLGALSKESPNDPDYRHLLALCYRDRRAGDMSDNVQQATAILEDLGRDFPNVSDYRFELVETYAKLDIRRLYFNTDGLDVAESRLRKALEIAEPLVAENPNVPDYSHSLATVYQKLAFCLRRRTASIEGDSDANRKLHEEVELIYGKAIDLHRLLRNKYPSAASYRIQLGMLRLAFADYLRKQDRLDETRQILKESISDLSKLLSENPDIWFLKGPLHMGYRTLSETLKRLGEEDAAAEASKKAEEYRGSFRGSPFGRPGEHRPPFERGRSDERRQQHKPPDA